jgi:hypothetical protein
MTKQKKIEIALWAIRNMAHQIGLHVESVLIDLGLMEPEQRIFFSKNERRNMGREDTPD